MRNNFENVIVNEEFKIIEYGYEAQCKVEISQDSATNRYHVHLKESEDKKYNGPSAVLCAERLLTEIKLEHLPDIKPDQIEWSYLVRWQERPVETSIATLTPEWKQFKCIDIKFTGERD